MIREKWPKHLDKWEVSFSSGEILFLGHVAEEQKLEVVEEAFAALEENITHKLETSDGNVEFIYVLLNVFSGVRKNIRITIPFEEKVTTSFNLVLRKKGSPARTERKADLSGRVRLSYKSRETHGDHERIFKW